MSYPFGLSPMGIGSILDHTFRIYRRNFAAIALFCLLIGGLGQFLVLLLQSLLLGGAYATSIQGLFSSYINLLSGDNIYSPDYAQDTMRYATNVLGALVMPMLLGLLTSLFVTPFVTGGVVNITAAYYHGVVDKPAVWFGRVRQTYGKLVRTGFARMVCMGASILALFFVFFVIAFAIGIITAAISGVIAGIFFVFFLIVFIAVVAAAIVVLISWIEMLYPVAVVENQYGFRGIGRSFKIFTKNFWKIVLLIILCGSIATAVTMPLQMVTVAFAFMSEGFPYLLMSVISNVISALLTALTAPLLPIAITLAYFDTRIRREGYDIAVRQRDQTSAEALAPKEEIYEPTFTPGN